MKRLTLTLACLVQEKLDHERAIREIEYKIRRLKGDS
jgi:hypothetical protein